MKKEEFAQALKNALAKSPKRKFRQSVELIINLKDVNLKKPEDRVDAFITLPKPHGRDVKICAMIGPEMKQASKFCDLVILEEEMGEYENKKKKIKKLAQEFDYFIAQAHLMPKIAKVFGRYFGPKGKMPNPKSGCVIPPNTNLEPLCAKLKKTVRVQTKDAPNLQVIVGKEDANADDITENVNAIYTQLLTTLPKEEHNIKNAIIKLTMGPAFRVGSGQKKKEDKG